MSTGGAGPLSGIKVIELAGFVSAPLATMMMADLGAEVVKVEPPRGDPFRRFGRAGTSVSPLFHNCNRGKEGVVLDLKDPDGNARLRALLEDADVLVSNWRPSVAARLGLADDVLVEAYPELIRVYVSGFGTTGPSVEAPVFDAIVQAHLGSAEADPPAIQPTYVVDKLTAAMACQATLAALFDRERGGTPQRIDLSLLDAAAYLTFVDTMVNRTFVDHAPEQASNQQAAAIRAVRTSDGWLIAAPVTSVQIRRTCELLGRPELADDLLAMADATALTTQLFAAIEAAAPEHPTAHWVEAFRSIDVPAGACLTIDQHLSDDQVVSNHLYDVVDRHELGRVRQVRYPAVFSDYGELWPERGLPKLPPRRKER